MIRTLVPALLVSALLWAVIIAGVVEAIRLAR
jgi:hypothetical protein